MNAPELLWKYAAGECSPQEKTELETRLAADPALREELALVQETHSALAAITPDQPSMRFAVNVMEALPKNIHATAPAEPLVVPRWQKIFWAAIATVFIGLLIWGQWAAPNSVHTLPIAENFSSGILSFTRFFSSSFAVMLTVVVASVGVLLAGERIWRPLLHKESS